ncbi:MAG: hypothetical protein K0S53_673 [Bacteroidetes bacterium]|jgi:hypothetical protein|nr:hypothetical protein [Bacteroidota bacterium]
MYSQLYFGKEWEKLKYKDIENFFSEKQEESDKIEFKSYVDRGEKSKTETENNIIRTICGMLNSEGGIIIWGAPKGEKKENSKILEFEGELTPLNFQTDKDSIIRRISDNIQVTPRGIRFRELKKPKEDKYICIFEIEKSEYSPHQHGNIYHMRIDGQTRPAPHHYIEALFKRISFPKLEGYTKPYIVRKTATGYIVCLKTCIFNLSKFQNEERLYFRITLINGEVRSNISSNYRRVTPNLDIVTYLPDKVFFASEHIVVKDEFLIKNETLAITNQMIEVIVYFGGKNSPLTVSRYKMDLSTPHVNVDDYIISKEENRMISDIYEDDNISNQDRIDRVMSNNSVTL